MQIWSKQPNKPFQIAVLLFDRFSNLCLANCLEPLRAANDFAGRPAYQWQFVSMDGGTIHSSSQLPVQTDLSLAKLTSADALFVMASYDHNRHNTHQLRKELQSASRRVSTIVGFDAGAWLMASAGLLDGRNATIHWDLLDSFSETFLNVSAQHAPFIKDGNRITCAGAMAAYDLSRDLIGDHHGASMLVDLDALFLKDAKLASNDIPTTKDPVLRRALDIMRGSLETPVSLPALARQLGTTPRTLERRFLSHLGAPPGEVYRHLRLSAAHQFVTQSSISVAEVALRCGYDSPAALTRAFKRRFGVPPRDLRSGKTKF